MCAELGPNGCIQGKMLHFCKKILPCLKQVLQTIKPLGVLELKWPNRRVLVMKCLSGYDQIEGESFSGAERALRF